MSPFFLVFQLELELNPKWIERSFLEEAEPYSKMDRANTIDTVDITVTWAGIPFDRIPVTAILQILVLTDVDSASATQVEYIHIEPQVSKSSKFKSFFSNTGEPTLRVSLNK